MKINEVNQLNEIINQLNTFDYSFLKNEDQNGLMFEKLTGNQIIKIIRDFVLAINEAQSKNELFAFGRSYTRPDSGAQSRLDIIVVSGKLVRYIENQDIAQIEIYALYVKKYLLSTGLHYYLLKNEIPASQAEIRTLKRQNTELTKELQARQKEQSGLLNEVKKLKNDLESFKNTKEKELTQITNNLQSTNQTKVQIDDTLNKVLASKTEIDKTIIQVQERSSTYDDELSKFIRESAKIYDTIKNTEIKIGEIKEWHGEEKNRITALNESSTEINEQLNRLLNPAIAKNLQLTFNKRKVWLFWSTLIWLGIVLGVTAFLGCYIYSLFESNQFSFEIEKVIVAAVKLIPIVTLLYFAINSLLKREIWKKNMLSERLWLHH